MSAEEGPLAKSEASGESHLRLVVVDDPEERAITAVAAEICGLACRFKLEFACAVGRLLVERFFDGDRAAWRSRAPSKIASLRKLSELLRGEVSLSASALSRCVAIHELVERLGGVATWQHLLPSHFRVVLPLPEPDQRRLLHDAESNRWDVRELTRAARVGTSRAVRRRPPAFVAAIRRIERVVVEQDLALKDLGRARELGSAATVDLYGRVLKIREKIELLQAALSPKTLAVERKGVRRTDDLR